MKQDKNGMARRAFLKRTALLSVGTVAAGAAAVPTIVEAAEPPPPTHGTELRGSNLTAQNRNAEGRFGIMFKQLSAYAPPDDLLIQLASACVLVPGQTATDPCTPRFLMEENPRSNQPTNATTTEAPKPNDLLNEAMNSANPLLPGDPLIPSSLLTTGVTFLGQFIDHDVTFDNTPLPDQQKDPNALTNFRTARYDLDSVYGLGPASEPQYYDRSNPDPYNRLKFRFTKYKRCDPTVDPSGFTEVPLSASDPSAVENVPRRNVTFADGSVKKVAIIPEPRNDQSLIVHQLHIAFMKFHNKVVDWLRTQRVSVSATYDLARRYTRWHFQWMVIHDFLKRIVDPAVVDDVFNNGPKFYDPNNPQDRAFIPVEWAMAAYRFGHSMVRPRYSMRDGVSGVPLFGAVTERDQFTILDRDENLEGLRPIPRSELVIQWKLFFNDPLAPAGSTLTKSAKPARKIDATLSFPLYFLPRSIVPATESNPEIMLAKRNLMRGVRVGLPSGQKVAEAMNQIPLSNVELARRHEYIVERNATKGIWEVKGERIVDDPALLGVLQHTNWSNQAPLWFYILKEAELTTGGRRLGPVGGRLVAEVLVGLLRRDPGSYVNMNPSWKPKKPIARVDGQFTIVDLLTFAGVYP